MSMFPWLVGGGALAAYAWSRGKAAKTPASTSPYNTPQVAKPIVSPTTPLLAGRWVWPVVKWRDRSPVVSDGVGTPRSGGLKHQGVDIMFKRQPTDRFAPGTPNGTKWFVMPDNVVAVAASEGVVWSAASTPHGFAVVIDHGPQKVATFYTHLEQLLVTPTSRAAAGQRVKAGQPIGIIGFSPLDGERLKHLHFEIWRGGPKDWIDPQPLLRTWEVLADPRGQEVIRNAGFVYRAVGSSGEPYPDWVRALKDKSGVYVIREIGGEIVYVGSSSGRLYDTLTRHLQTWRRWKGFWKGQYGEGHDPGLTYERGSVEIAIRLTSPADALDEEMRLIRRLKPRDNLIGQPELADVPF